jgi:hypothetical protein
MIFSILPCCVMRLACPHFLARSRRLQSCWSSPSPYFQKQYETLNCIPDPAVYTRQRNKLQADLKLQLRSNCHTDLAK